MRRIVAAVLAMLAGCRGVPGPTGPVGHDGKEGPAGLDCVCEIEDAGVPGLSVPSARPVVKHGAVAAPGWVLRDRRGWSVAALVGPAFANASTWSNPKLARFGARPRECVLVEYLGQEHIDLRYALATGHPEPCYEETPWQGGNRHWLDRACEEQAYVPTLVDSFFAAPILVDRVLWYATERSVSVGDAHVYRWDFASNQCVRVPAAERPAELWPYKRVPKWALELLPDAPYTLTLEY